MRRQKFDIKPAPSNGQRFIETLHFGAQGARPKVYIQAGLHAEEAPGVAVALALARVLKELERQDQIIGEIVLVPVANPIGAEQRLLGEHLGRFEIGSGQNFNRNFPNAGALLLTTDDRVPCGQMPDMVAELRARMKSALAVHDGTTSLQSLQLVLLRLAIDADIVLDMHCDSEAIVHLYGHSDQTKQLARLGSHLGAGAILHAGFQGGWSFEEACTLPWKAFQAKWPAIGLPVACFATTLEWRGIHDVEQSQTARDAEGIISFLIEQGAIRGVAATRQASIPVTPLDGVEILHSPGFGTISYSARLGQHVQAGDVMAEFTDITTGTITALHSTISGVFYARERRRLVHTNSELTFVAGATRVRTGMLLSA